MSGRRTAGHLDQARKLIAGGAPGAAVALLRRKLSGRNPFLAPAQSGVRDLAELFVRLTANDPAEATTIGWAAYLHRATIRLNGDVNATARMLTELAQRRAAPTPPIIDPLAITNSRAAGGLRAGQTVAARFSVAELLRAHGLCEVAEREVIGALYQWAPNHDHAPDVTYVHLVEALAMLDRCGRIKQGESLLNAYAAMLPEAGTDEDAFLRSYVGLRLGIQREIQRHEEVCRQPSPRRRRTYGNLREAILRSLA